MRARGGFEVVSMEWKDAKLIKAVIRSALGGNLRLRVPNKMTLSNGDALKKATGMNPNPFYQTDETPKPIVSPTAVINPPVLKETFLYDIQTQRGKEYILIEQ